MANAEIRVRDSDAVYGALLADPECRACGGPAAEAHHLVPKGSPHFGDDVPENIVPLCRDHHAAFHGVGSLSINMRAAIGRRLTPQSVGYVVEKMGPGAAAEFLHRKYLVARDDWRHP